MAEPGLRNLTVLYGKLATGLTAASPDFEKKMRSLVVTHIKQVALLNSLEDDSDGCPEGHMKCPDGSCMPIEVGCVS